MVFTVEQTLSVKVSVPKPAMNQTLCALEIVSHNGRVQPPTCELGHRVRPDWDLVDAVLNVAHA